jgi:hypothetical protein
MSLLASGVEGAGQEVQALTGKKPGDSGLPRVLSIGAIIALVGVLLYESRALWAEWSLLQGARVTARQSQIVGYRDITPSACYANPPDDWFRDAGDDSLLWARWKEGIGHEWYRFPRGQLDQGRLHHPLTPFLTHPIDFPVVENDGGEIWERIPPDAKVVGQTLLGIKCVYPVLVLDKVQVVNDLVREHPYLVAFNSFAPTSEAVSIFESECEGRRLTMAATGYFHDGKPLLCDRGTESLWYEEAGALKSVAGLYKGARLQQVGHPGIVSWKSWMDHNAGSRLLVGADRSRGIPRE